MCHTAVMNPVSSSCLVDLVYLRVGGFSNKEMNCWTFKLNIFGLGATKLNLNVIFEVVNNMVIKKWVNVSYLDFLQLGKIPISAWLEREGKVCYVMTGGWHLRQEK